MHILDKERMETVKTFSFKELIEQQRQNNVVVDWEGTIIDYLHEVQNNPIITQLAPSRIFNMIIKEGTEEVDSSLKIKGYEDLVRYNFFKDKIYGDLGPIQAIHDIMRFMKAAANRTETGKRILILVGPVSSGKSTILKLIKRGMELDETPIYRIKGCPLNEEPLHAIPMEQRPFWEEKLGVKIEGTLCPYCLNVLEREHKIDNHIHWEDLQVEQFSLSEQSRRGIGTFQPSDPKAQDVTELIGRVNMSKIARFGETDPRAYQFDGELEIANRGLMEYIEILKADVKFHYVLITVAQEQVLKAPGFPQIYVDTLVLGHTNKCEFDIFKADKKNEALHDRMYPIVVPWNLKLDDEVKIYKKMIAESAFANKIHIAPWTLETAAQFAILSRLEDSTIVSSKVEKMKLYNGEKTESFKREEVDIKALIEEGQKKGEGQGGISPRFIINAINVALGMKEGKKCLNPIDVIRGLRENFNHAMGVTEEDKQKYLTLLTGEKDNVNAEYKEIAKREVNMAFLIAYEEQATALFENYIRQVTAFCSKEKVYDSITGEYSTPDEKLMRSIEELISVPVNSKAEFRNGIFIHKVRCLEKGERFTFKTYLPLREAIEKKLMSDLKNVVSLTLCDKTAVDGRTQKRRNDALQSLIDRGYCEHCAEILLQFVSEVLRKEG